MNKIPAIIVFAVASAAIVIVGRTVSADQPSLMREVTANVKEICAAPSESGRYWDVNMKGGGEAKVKLKRLANIGVSGEVTFTEGEWQGVQQVLREHRAGDLDSYRRCVQRLTPMFLEKFATGSKNMHSTGTTFAGTYWMDGMSHRVITVRHKTGNQYSVAEYTSPWKWEGTVIIEGSEISGQVRFIENNHPLWLTGSIQGNGNINVTYVFLDKVNMEPTNRRDKHVWVEQR